MQLVDALLLLVEVDFTGLDVMLPLDAVDTLETMEEVLTEDRVEAIFELEGLLVFSELAFTEVDVAGPGAVVNFEVEDLLLFVEVGFVGAGPIVTLEVAGLLEVDDKGLAKMTEIMQKRLSIKKKLVLDRILTLCNATSIACYT